MLPSSHLFGSMPKWRTW